MHAPSIDGSPEMACLCDCVSTSASLASLSESGPSDSDHCGPREEDLLEAGANDSLCTTNNAAEDALASDLAVCSPPGLTLCRGPLRRQKFVSTTGSDDTTDDSIEEDDLEDDASDDPSDAGSVACRQALSGPHKVTPAFCVSSMATLIDLAEPCFVRRAHGCLYLWQ